MDSNPGRIAMDSGSQAMRRAQRTLPLSAFVVSALALFAVAVFAGNIARPAEAIPEGLPPGYVSEDIARNLGLTTDFLFLPDERCLVLLKSGRILMLKGKKVTGIVADLSDRLGSHVGDRGLVSIEMHPKFPEVPYLYVGYVYDGTEKEINEIFAPLASDSPKNQPYYPVGPKLDRLSRFTMKGDIIDPASEVILIGNCTKRQGIWWGDDCSPMIGITHSIDWIKFGPDGALWVSVGDGASFEGVDWTPNVGNDWLGPMDPDFLPGSILRLDENGNGLPDNPYFNGDPTAARSRVWAKGLRQPWRCEFVPNTNPPELLCGIVGWYTWESLAFITKGANLGWPCWEGPEKPPYFVVNGTGNWDDAICQKFYVGNATTKYPKIKAPVPTFNHSYYVYGWNHNGQSSAIIAGTFAPKSFVNEFKDCFFVGDFVSSKVECVPWDFVKHRPVNFNMSTDSIGWEDVPMKHLGSKFDQPVTFKIGPDGNFWVLGHCVQCSGYGILRRIIAPNGNTTLPYGNATVGPVGGGDTGGLVILTGDQCYPKDQPRIKVADLPNGWDSIMYVNQFPNVRYPRNGNFGPIEVDSSVGKAGAFDGSLLSVGGVTYRNGLGTFATSEIHLPTLGYCYRFTAEVGVDDEVLKNAPAGTLTYKDKGFGEFIVKGDGAVIHNHSDFTGTYAKTGVEATKMELTNLHQYSDVGLYAWKPWGNRMAMADTSANHLDWAEARLYCGPDSPYIPKIDISYPEPKNSFNLGDDVIFSGTINAYDDSALPAQSYQWYVNLVHCQGALCHQHFLENFSGIKNGVFSVQPHPLDNDKQYIYYQLKLVGTDLCGRTAYQVRNIIIGGNSSTPSAGTETGGGRTPTAAKREKLRKQVALPSAEESYQTLMEYRRQGMESGPEDALLSGARR